jgi:gliding motility-associated-like protein
MDYIRLTRKFSLLLVGLIFLSTSLCALHIKGGWMSYQYIGTDAQGNIQYAFTVKVFRDCGPQSPGQNDGVINITLFRNGDNTFAGTFAASLTQNTFLRKTTFNPCVTPIPDVCYVVLEYRGNVSVPPTPLGYTASFQRCCRINGIVNVLQPSNNLGNTYTITLPGNANNANNLQNSSPIFVEKDTALVCFNSSFELDYSASDPDGDSLVYEFAPALQGASSGNPAPVQATAPPYNSLPYGGSYSTDNPFGNNISINRRTGQISGISPAITGEYVIAVTVKEYRNGRFIAESRKELHVNVANCSLPDADLPVELINCESLEVLFENRSFSPAINSYYWEFGVPGNPNNSTTVTRPSFTYPDTGTYIAKLVVNRGQPCTDSTTMAVKVYPGFFPGFEADGSCFSNPFQFSDTTFARYGNTIAWRWDFGNPNATNDTSRLRNPAYTYPAPGTYNISLRATSNKGCEKTVTVPLQVLDKPFLNMAFKDTLICSIDSLQLRALGSGTFTWTPNTGRIFNANTSTPTVYPLTSTTYSVTINDRGCVTSDTVRVNVLDFITVDAGRDTTICLGDPVILRPVTAGLSFQWLPANSLNNAQIRNPAATPTNISTTYTVIANLGKCQDRDSVTITTVPYPLSNAGTDTSICFGDAITLIGSGNGNRFQWVPSVGLSTPTNAVTTASPTSTTIYTLQVFDNRGCPKPGTSSVTVTVIPRIEVFAGNDTSIVFNQPLRINAISNAPINTWVPSTGLSTTSGLTPVLTLNSNDVSSGTNFVIYRIVSTTPEGCMAEDELVVRIFSTGPSIFVPNAFTPNNDGLNDRIRPILAGIERLEYFRIFNRYGQIVFESREPESGWDGRYKSQLQGSGTFVYQIQAIDFTGEVLKQSGTFTLIR